MSNARIVLALVGFAVGGAQVTAAETRPARRHGSLHPPDEKELIYVALPGTLEGSWDHNGNGIVVLDAGDNYNVVKRIPTWNIAASRYPEQVAGVTASPITQMIYIAARGRLGAWDLQSEHKVWENAFDGHCCERPQIAPDGSFMYVGSDLKDFWYVVDPKTGKLITKVVSPLSPNAHNLNLSPDGKTAFMSPNGKVMGIADTTTHTLAKTITFPDNVRVFVVNHDASLIYSNINNLLGFVVAEVKSGAILQTVAVKGFGWPGRWTDAVRAETPHGCPSHGIALTPDERELWLADGINNMIHIFDSTKMPPRPAGTIKTSAGPFWITVGLDGKRAYVSSGDVIDMKTRKIVGQMKDEYGRTMYSEKLLDMVFTPFTSLADIYAAAYDLWHGGNRREAFAMFGRIQAFASMVQLGSIDVLMARGVLKPGTRTRKAAPAPGTAAGPPATGGPPRRTRQPPPLEEIRRAIETYLRPYLKG